MIDLRVGRSLIALSDAGEELFDWIDLSRPVDRRTFWFACLLAIVSLAIGYAMDWFVFGTTSLTRPDFFACVIAAALALPLVTLGVRRLRDVGRSGWFMLLLAVPILGPLVLMLWWSEPGDALKKEGCDDRNRRRCTADRTDDTFSNIHQRRRARGAGTAGR